MTTELRTCNGCGSYRLCRLYRGLWLCQGPSRCYRNRRVIKALVDRGRELRAKGQRISGNGKGPRTAVAP